MLQPVQFDELALYLKERANRDEFGKQFFQVGPLSIRLAIEPSCADLGLTDPLERSGFKNTQQSPVGGLMLFVMQLPKYPSNSILRGFLADNNRSSSQFVGATDAMQVIIKDTERKMLKVFDQKNGIGLLAFEDRELLPSWELFSPLKEFIHLQALNQSCLLLHAASLVSPDRPEQGTLIVGPGGSGKSTLTAYGIEQGMLTNGDDYVLVDLRQDKPQCWSVYRTLKLHPSSPVLQGKNPWRVWRTDALTGKSVILADSVDHGGALLPQAKLTRVCGLSLQQSPDIHNPKANSILSDPHRHPYLHTCMSTIQQIPYRMAATLALSKKLHQSIPYSAHTMAPGIPGLQQALLETQGQA